MNVEIDSDVGDACRQKRSVSFKEEKLRGGSMKSKERFQKFSASTMKKLWQHCVATSKHCVYKQCTQCSMKSLTDAEGISIRQEYYMTSESYTLSIEFIVLRPE